MLRRCATLSFCARRHPTVRLFRNQSNPGASSCQPGCGSLLQQPKDACFIPSIPDFLAFPILLPETGKCALHAMIQSFPRVRDCADISAAWPMIRQVRLQTLFHRVCVFSLFSEKRIMEPQLRMDKEMRQILNEETIQKLETLAGELRAISHWDTAYWRSRRPEWYEIIAFVSRQKRRGEIIVQLLGSPGHRSRRAAALGKQSIRSQSKSEESKRKF